jgi:large subunit ribosomal protein L17
MRHHDNKRKFHREKRQRVALMRSLARSLVLHGQIDTTLAKAKELRPYIERLVTTSKKPTLASRRAAVVKIGDSEAVKKLHEELAKRYADRNGGYTRIVRLGRVGKRVGEQARIEFVQE